MTESDYSVFEGLLMTFGLCVLCIMLKKLLDRTPCGHILDDIPLVAYYFVFGTLRVIIIDALDMKSGAFGYKNVNVHYFSFILIPLMLAKDSLFIDIKSLLHNWKQVATLVLCGFAVSATLIMIFSKFLLKWNWAQAGTFASIVSCTDPVAVVGILDMLGVNSTLSMWIAGESLFNDGVAVVAFKNFDKAMEETLTSVDVLKSLGLLVGAGIVLGIAFGILVFAFNALDSSRHIANHHVHVLVYHITPFAIWYVAEVVIGCSGILAVVTFGCIFAAFRKEDPEVTKQVKDIMEFIVETMEMILFHWGGMYVAHVAHKVEWSDWAYVPLIYVLIYLVRILAVLPTYYVLRLEPSFKPSWMGVCIHGALRGGLSLFLALEIQEKYEDDFANLLAFHVAMFVFLTTIVNGITLTKVCEKLGIEMGQDSEEDSVGVDVQSSP